MIIMDSGLGGISVVRAIRAVRPNYPLIYLADTAGFPYGNRSAEEIGERATALLQQLVAMHTPRSIVLACNTLSTLCLAQLRAAIPTPFVGTVPAIKTAAAHAKRFTLLATPNTAHSAYSANLITQFARPCVVDCYGAPRLAAMAEANLLGTPMDPEMLRNELAPAFVEDARGRTEAIVLGCTHYPLVLDALRTVAPWQVAWIDSGNAIARRALSQSDTPPDVSIAYVTSTQKIVDYRDVFMREGFAETRTL